MLACCFKCFTYLTFHIILAALVLLASLLWCGLRSSGPSVFQQQNWIITCGFTFIFFFSRCFWWNKKLGYKNQTQNIQTAKLTILSAWCVVLFLHFERGQVLSFIYQMVLWSWFACQRGYIWSWLWHWSSQSLTLTLLWPRARLIMSGWA